MFWVVICSRLSRFDISTNQSFHLVVLMCMRMCMCVHVRVCMCVRQAAPLYQELGFTDVGTARFWSGSFGADAILSADSSSTPSANGLFILCCFFVCHTHTRTRARTHRLLLRSPARKRK